MHCYVERYKSNEFIEIKEFDMKSKKSDFKIKKPIARYFFTGSQVLLVLIYYVFWVLNHQHRF